MVKYVVPNKLYMIGNEKIKQFSMHPGATFCTLASEATKWLIAPGCTPLCKIWQIFFFEYTYTKHFIWYVPYNGKDRKNGAQISCTWCIYYSCRISYSCFSFGATNLRIDIRGDRFVKYILFIWDEIFY